MLTGPLTTLQMEHLDKVGPFNVVKMLNEHGGSQPLSEKALRKAFEKWWPDLETEIANFTSALSASRDRSNVAGVYGVPVRQGLEALHSRWPFRSRPLTPLRPT